MTAREPHAPAACAGARACACAAARVHDGARYPEPNRQLKRQVPGSAGDVHDAAAVALRSGEATIVSGTDPQAPTIRVDGTDVSGPIRGEAVTGAVSPVATVKEVRERMVALQRAIIAEKTGTGPGIVVEGRDIASHVAPEAQVKVYLTADPAARAARRAAEEGGSDLAATEAVLRSRDEIDSGRETSPLTMVDGAAHIDSTHLSLDQVIEEVVALVRAAEVQA